MPKINFLYLAVLPLCFLLYRMQSAVGTSSAFFYGFAENKETELSHNRPVKVGEIFVSPGQEVVKGTLLMEVTQAEVAQKINEKGYDLERLRLLATERKLELRQRIRQVEVRKETKIAAVENEIQTVEAAIQRNQELREGLTSISTPSPSTTATANDLRLTNLRAEIELLSEPLDLEISQLKAALREIDKPVIASQKKLESELDYYATEKEALAILAPSDGIIGNVLCKPGEYVAAFSTMIDFYERNPTVTKGFVHESLIPEVKIGDKLKVSSSLHPDQWIDGTVTGLGSRIVEIPERLRKIPDFKTYGREVLIQIPGNNTFLQKEKVMVNTGDETGSGGEFWKIFGF